MAPFAVSVWRHGVCVLLLIVCKEVAATGSSEGGGFFGLPDWGQVAISAVLAGLASILVTLAIERLGGHLGGVLGGTPSTIIFAAFGVAQRTSKDDLTKAMFTVAPGMFINAMFLLSWRLLPPRLPQHWSLCSQLIVMISTSLALWLTLAASLWAVNTYAISSTRGIVTFGLFAFCCVVSAGVVACFRPLPSPAGAEPISLRVYLLRGVFAGLSIGGAVLLSSTSAVVAGVATVFPSIFLTSMVALSLSQHKSVSVGAVGPLMLGSGSVALFAMLYAVFSTIVDDVSALAICYILSVLCYSVPVYFFIRWRRMVSKNPSTGRSSSMISHGPPGSLTHSDDVELHPTSTVVESDSEMGPMDGSSGAFAGVFIREKSVSKDGILR